MRQFISFYLGSERYAIDILLSKEIGRINEISPVPEAEEYFIGIMNLRGQILTVLDPQFFLIQKSTKALEDRVLIILKTKAELSRLNKLNRKNFNNAIEIKDPLAILVDSMGETVTVDDKDILPPLPNVANEKKEFISGLIQQNNQFIIILAIEQLIKRL
ncbi:MAG: chemotaxis protein CheW [Methylococcaceae bacterium]